MEDRLYVHKKTVYMCITYFTNSFVVVIQFQGFLVVFSERGSVMQLKQHGELT